MSWMVKADNFHAQETLDGTIIAQAGTSVPGEHSINPDRAGHIVSSL